MVNPTRDWTSIVVQFVPAILGSGVLITTFTGYYNDLANQPIVRFTLFPDTDNSSKFSAIIENTGGGPATNFTGLIITPYPIVNYNGLSLTTNDLSTQGSNALRISIPRFIQGEGSLVNVSLIMDRSRTYNYGYQAYATFDQGSVKGNIYEPANIFTDFEELVVTPIGFAVLGISITIIGFVIRYVFLRYRRFRYSKAYKRDVSEYSAMLDTAFSDYKKAKGLDPNAEVAAYALLSLEESRARFDDRLTTFEVPQILPNVEKDTTIAKKHDAYFKAILDDESRGLTINESRNRYFDMLDKKIVELSPKFPSDRILPDLMVRFGNFRKIITGT